jgi:hypothetical protein
MTTQEENLTIKIEPPEIPKASWLIRKCVAGVSSDEVLTTITDIDLFIEILQSNLDALETYKKVLVNRAISENIKEDFGAVLIEILGKKNRNPILDIEHFKTTFPDGYKSIRDQQKIDLEEIHKRDLTFLEVSPIPLGIADKKIGKDIITEFAGFKPQDVKIVVQRKQGMKKELLG